MSAAIHEAGHVVVAKRIFGGRVRASLGAHDSGVTDFEFAEALPTRYEAAKRLATVLLAGEVARLLANGQDPLHSRATQREVAAAILRHERRVPYQRSSSAHDRNAYEWLHGVFTEEFGDELRAWHALDAVLPGLLRQATKIVRERNGEVARLAERLDAEQAISI